MLKLPNIRDYRCYHIGTAAGVHKAIRRGLIKSRGIAFRGKSNPDPDDPREKYKRKHKLPDFSNLPPRNFYRQDGDADYRKSGQEFERPIIHRNENYPKYENRSILQGGYNKSNLTRTLRETMKNDMDRERSLEESDRYSSDPSLSSQKKPSKAGWKRLMPELSRGESPDTDRPLSRNSFRENRPRSPASHGFEGNQFERAATPNRRTRRALQFGKPLTKKHGSRRIEEEEEEHQFKFKLYPSNKKSIVDNTSYKKVGQETPPVYEALNGLSNRRLKSLVDMRGSEIAELGQRNDPFIWRKGPAFEQYGTPHKENMHVVDDSKMPVSIPYTTSASEFLYGSSVVEKVLTSSTESQRKIYKFYIYNGVNRENHDQDNHLQRLAESKGITVERVGNDWIRTLDKMSSGRPHNGYILEVSPLPKLPVKCLKEVTTRSDTEGNEQKGFNLELDHQTREEENINGTTSFVQIRRSLSGKQPLVLVLDQILDPGNLGGILRTASFFGISAIAISTRNCASITPVVSKASAGASESVKLLSIQNPTDFIVDSKKNGWFVYAAIAPSQINSLPFTREAISLENIIAGDPLPDAPSIIMIGGEGEGLRRSLLSKANTGVYIPGCQETGVESLNVTVATGIICYNLCQKLQQRGLSQTGMMKVSQTLETPGPHENPEALESNQDLRNDEKGTPLLF